MSITVLQKIFSKQYFTVLAVLCICTVQPAVANDLFRFSGFGTIGAVVTDEDRLGFQRNLNREATAWGSDVDFGVLSALGLQLNTQFDSKVNIVGQWVLRPGMEKDLDSATRILALTYDPSAAWQFRLGRVVQSIYMLSDSSRIGFAHLWTLPVQEFYGPTPIEFADGVELNHYRPIGNGYLSARAVFGVVNARQKDDFGNTVELKLNRVRSLMAQYDIGNWLVRVSYADAILAEIDDDRLVQLSAALQQIVQATGGLWQDGSRLASLANLRDSESKYLTAGIAYDNGIWDVKSEFYELDADSSALPRIGGAYLSVGKRYGAFTPYMLASYSETLDQPESLDQPLPPIPGVDLLAGGVLSFVNNNFDQKSISAGFRWNVKPTQAVKVQLDHKMVKDNAWSFWQQSRATDLSADSINVLSLTYEFVF